MTIYSDLCVCGGPIVSPFVSGDKGGIINRTKCAGEQAKNVIGLGLETAGVVLGTGLAAKTLTKKPGLLQKAANGFDKVVKAVFPGIKKDIELVGKSGKVSKTFEITHGKFADKILKMPGKTKVLGALGLAALGTLVYITSKATYNMGQIDQKYTDRANLRIDA